MMGYTTGIAPIHVQTWMVYKSFESIQDKILAQQVLQEGVGLDSSAGNIMKMLEAGDPATADAYAQITADEKNHVSLGLKWFHALDNRPLEEAIDSVTEKLLSIYRVPKVPIVPELRRMCGFSDEWIARETIRRGKLDMTEICCRIRDIMAPAPRRKVETKERTK